MIRKVIDMQVPTKEQEREALSQIKSILDSLGEYSYVATAFDGCAEIAEDNIKYDFLNSVAEKYERATERATQLAKSNKTLNAENASMKETIKLLNCQLDKELEWQFYEDSRHISQEQYGRLERQPDTKVMKIQRYDDIHS